MKRSCIWSKHYHCYEFILHPSSRFRSYRLIEIQNGYLFIRRYVQDSYFTSFSKVGYHSGTLGWWLPCNIIRDTLVLRECNQEPRGRKVCFLRLKIAMYLRLSPPSSGGGAACALRWGPELVEFLFSARLWTPSSLFTEFLSLLFVGF